jgi:hypothetical protein
MRWLFFFLKIKKERAMEANNRDMMVSEDDVRRVSDEWGKSEGRSEDVPSTDWPREGGAEAGGRERGGRQRAGEEREELKRWGAVRLEV